MKKNSIDKLFDRSLDILHIKLKKEQRDLLLQIFKFVIVGGISTIIDWIIYYICYKYLKINPLISNIIGFSISVIYNFIASVNWVFNVNKSKNKKSIFVQFILFSIIGLLISEALLFIFINKIGMHAMLSKIIATAIVMTFNFVTRKIFLEKD